MSPKSFIDFNQYLKVKIAISVSDKKLDVKSRSPHDEASKEHFSIQLASASTQLRFPGVFV